MTAITELAPGISVEFIERKHHHLIRQNGGKRLYVISRGQRSEGEMWCILDHPGYRQLVELRGSTSEAAIARAVAMLRDGTIDQMLKKQSDVQKRGYAASADLNDPRNWTVAQIRRELSAKRAEHEVAMRRHLEEIARLETALAEKRAS
jgi:hypothetical protein